MPKFSFSMDFNSDATVGDLVNGLTALIARIKRGEPNESKLLNEVGSFHEFYDIDNPENSNAGRD